MFRPTTHTSTYLIKYDVGLETVLPNSVLPQDLENMRSLKSIVDINEGKSNGIKSVLTQIKTRSSEFDVWYSWRCPTR